MPGLSAEKEFCYYHLMKFTLTCDKCGASASIDLNGSSIGGKLYLQGFAVTEEKYNVDNADYPSPESIELISFTIQCRKCGHSQIVRWSVQ